MESSEKGPPAVNARFTAYCCWFCLVSRFVALRTIAVLSMSAFAVVGAVVVIVVVTSRRTQ